MITYIFAFFIVSLFDGLGFAYPTALCAGFVLVAVAFLGGQHLAPKATSVASVDDTTAAREMTFLRAMDPDQARHRELQNENTCSVLFLCSSQLFNLDGRSLRNPDPLFGDSCVDRCIPSPFIGFYKRFLGYSCGICIFN
jgi:hypothetical protein